MKLTLVDNYDQLSRFCARIVLETICNKPNAVICLPTGNTPLGLYKQLVGANTPPDFWNQIRIICLDEYLGIAPSDYRSFFRWQSKEFLEPLGIATERVYQMESTGTEPNIICMEFEERIAALGKLDLCVLGLGLNGHLGFNEPGTRPDSRTHCVRLTEETVAANAAYWGGDAENVPNYGITLGLANIIESQEIIVLVSGTHKSAVLKKVMEGVETLEVPASYLKRSERVTIVADREAAALLNQSN